MLKTNGMLSVPQLSRHPLGSTAPMIAKGDNSMDDFIKLLLAGILSGTVISSVVGLLLYRRTTKIAEDIKSEYAKSMTIFESSRSWKEKSVALLLGPLYMQFDRTQRAFDRWQDKNLYLEAKVIREGNLTIRDLLLSKSDLIPPERFWEIG
jgi:putative intracellular protease/amidase